MKLDKQRAEEAFEYYVNLATARSHKAVSLQFKVGERTVNEWSRKYNWIGRLNERLDEIARRKQEESIRRIVKQRPQIAIGLNNMIARFLKDNPSIKTLAELDVALKNLRLELGEPTEHTKNESDIEISEKMSSETERKLIDALNEMAREENKKHQGNKPELPRN